ncbi:MAG: hypothetical protein FWE20_09145 [Defluviitaleaceae bacterium]|nr:hypothetical protein [Defluviitaleaceae bacterium]
MNTVMSLIKSIQEISDDDNSKPCKKTVQKLAYLIQEKGVDLGLDYTIHFYGPYSEDLDLEIRYLNSRGDVQIDFGSSSGHLISVEDDTYNDVELLEIDAQEIIGIFRSKKPSDLELLATTLYVQREQQYADVNMIRDGVVKIKGNKYSPEKITNAIKELSQNNYFTVK